ncbi:addiction module antidote protein [Hyphomonas polymorpha PS728]|uniref:Addiction module antidote protein n=1 Tax=Hyphomonas polymorpha PS728 TaxID=1280954 RepID=A0A062VAW8_9PROT|nr:type II toxin-antitoxin system ParD family antitoxin [Hyphomonas polymorpha]KCZ97342.1 addiction module antidote protein [Hyphomonas polymorpha PS728]
MTTVRKTITLTDKQDEWIKSQISRGAYTNDSEVMRDLIRRAQAESDRLEAIRAALMEGERSGLSDMTPEAIRAAVRKRKSLK